MSATNENLPERIGLIPRAVVRRHLTAPVLRGEEPLPAATLDSATTPWEVTVRSDAKPVRELFVESMERFGPGGGPRADAWLAPRLHATLRITRREAADARMWDFLSARLAPDYVAWRYRPPATERNPMPAVSAARYSGPFHVQAFSRLWWAAELFRDGSDYGPVVTACANQETFQTFLRADIVHHRPSAQAIVELLGTTREAVALSKALNAAATTLTYEALAWDHRPDVDAYRAWIDELAMTSVPFDRLPEGPSDGAVDRAAVAVLVPLFKQLASGTRVRDRAAQSMSP